MGIRERRERHRAEQREGILRAAREIASQSGWPALTIRGIAERIEYSPPVIYDHFAGKAEVLAELRRAGFAELADAAALAIAGRSDPRERLLAAVEAYWDFARANPDVYLLMHDLTGAGAGADPWPAESGRLTEIAGRLVHGAAPGLGAAEKVEAIMVLWGTIHGLAMLGLSGALPGGAEGVRLLFRRAATDFIRAWGA
ncbi:MAG TPA: TetR/AcrR family transcriptional regulator [Candidatus Dormibacteraeota bacterium]|nr:TetR/AcrR family transcriptional regulator [Candidatus Dormibacteraeota bacterium]